MSALGHWRTSVRPNLMSALLAEADVPSAADNVRLVPLATNAVHQIASYSITSSARAGVLPDRMSTPRRPDAGVPQRPKARTRRPRQPAEAATPSNYFLCRDPGAGFAPSCMGECAIAARV